MEKNLQRFRDQFPHVQRGIRYLNHAAQSPLAATTVQAIQNHLNERHNGSLDTDEQDTQIMEECRLLVRELLNARNPGQIAFVYNTSHGLNLVTSGLTWRHGDEIILNTIEFPTNVYPYRKLEQQGVRCRFVDACDGTVPLERIEQSVTERTRMIAISAVQFLSGYFADMEGIGRLCRERDILFVVDGIQAAGAVPIDVEKWGVDAFACGGLKWLMAPTGIGFLYLSGRLSNQLSTPDPGWLSVQDPWNLLQYDQPYKTDALRYESGVPNVPGLCGLKGSLELLLETGIESIYRQVLQSNLMLRDGLAAMGLNPYTCEDKERQSGILTFRLPEGIDPLLINKALRDQQIYISVRDHKLRFSPHGYNSPEEIEAVINATEMIFSSVS